MSRYDILVQSLHRNYQRHNTKWVRNVVASSLSEAARKAEAAHPDLGVTPTIMSMGWPVLKKGLYEQRICTTSPYHS